MDKREAGEEGEGGGEGINVHEDPGEESVEKRRMAEAGLQKKVKRRRRRRRRRSMMMMMMMKRRKKKKSTACRGEKCVAQCWKRDQRGVRSKEPGGGSGRRAPEMDQERCCLWCCLWCSVSGGV